MDKLIKFNHLYPRLCDIKGCKNLTTSFIEVKGFTVYISLCDDCGKKLYKELKEEFENDHRT